MPLTLYDILNVPYHASIDDIKQSFWSMAKRYHPDSSQNGDPRKFEIITKAYKILGNEQLKKSYDKKILSKNVIFDQSGHGYAKIPKKRIEYISSLKNLTNHGLLNKKLIKRKHRLANFQYDVSIGITLNENRQGVICSIPLPARGVCTVCYGSDRMCYLCDGIGNILTVEDLNLIVPPNSTNHSIIEINLKDNPPKNMMHFTLETIRILIYLINP